MGRGRARKRKAPELQPLGPVPWTSQEALDKVFAEHAAFDNAIFDFDAYSKLEVDNQADVCTLCKYRRLLQQLSEAQPTLRFKPLAVRKAIGATLATSTQKLNHSAWPDHLFATMAQKRFGVIIAHARQLRRRTYRYEELCAKSSPAVRMQLDLLLDLLPCEPTTSPLPATSAPIADIASSDRKFRKLGRNTSAASSFSLPSYPSPSMSAEEAAEAPTMEEHAESEAPDNFEPDEVQPEDMPFVSARDWFLGPSTGSGTL